MHSMVILTFEYGFWYNMIQNEFKTIYELLISNLSYSSLETDNF